MASIWNPQAIKGGVVNMNVKLVNSAFRNFFFILIGQLTQKTLKNVQK